MITPPHIRRALQEIKGQLNAGSVEPARAALKQLILASPGTADAHYLLGMAHTMAKDYHAAFGSLQLALQIDRRNPAYQFQCGFVLQSLGQIEGAATCFQEAIRLSPKFHEAHYNLGFMLQVQGNFDGAIRCYRNAILHKPEMVEALNNLGNLLITRGQPDEALILLQRAVRVRPNFHVPYNNIGNALVKLGRGSEAVAAFRKAVELSPNFVEAITSLAEQLHRQGDGSAALSLYDRAIDLDPDNELIRFARDALAHGNPAKPPDEYVRKVFRDLAETFDEHLVENLGYGIPALLMEELQTWIESCGPLSVLDLGCGTGLFGVQVKPHSRNLVGVDLSAEMLAKAQARQLYDKLVETDLAAFLGEVDAASFDLVVATDVFIYLGELEQTFKKTSQALTEKGRFAFSVEGISNTEGTYLLRESSRYAHSPGYIGRLALQHGFTMVKRIETVIRKEGNAPVPGCVFVLEKAASA